MEINFNYLFQYLKKDNIQVDKSEFLFQIQSHPSYPSLLAISDTLSFFKISNLVTKLENENIEYLPDNFIALIKNGDAVPALAFVERTKKGFQYSENNNSINLDSEMFIDVFQNIVLLADGEENEIVPDNSNKLLIYGSVFLGLIYLASIFITGFSLLAIILICFASVGVYLSVEAISHEFGVKTKFSEAVCGMSTNSDCSAVINSKKSRILELFSFSDASIAFFSFQLLALLLFSVSNQLGSFYNLSTMMLILSLPVTALSFYQQKIVAKKWCPICIAIIGLIYLELISLLILNNGLNFFTNLQSILYFSLVLVGSYLATIVVKKTIKKNIELQSDVVENNRFKRKYSLFKMALLSSEKVNNEIIINENVVLGNKEAKLKIVIISSPFCGHCKEAHKLIEEILDRHKEKVCINLHFNYHEVGNEKSKRVHYKFAQIYFNQGQNAFLKALHKWYENMDEEELVLKNETQLRDSEIAEILLQQSIWNKENKLMFTPAIIINDYIFPKEYDRNDLIYFINDLEDDVDFS